MKDNQKTYEALKEVLNLIKELEEEVRTKMQIYEE